MPFSARLALAMLLLPPLVGCGKDDAAPAAAAESAAAASPAAPPPATAGTPTDGPAPRPFHLDSIPLAKAPLPEFPYVAWPDVVPATDRSTDLKAAVGAVTLIAGDSLRTVEGRTERRLFSLPDGSSPLEMRRYYRDRITALGGVPVNRLQPTNDAAMISEAVRKLFPADADPAKRLGLNRYDEGQYQYEVYVVRTATATAWFVVETTQYSVIVTTVGATAG